MRTIICLVLVKESSLKEEAHKMKFKGLKLTPGLLPCCLPRSWGAIPVTGLCTNVPSYTLVVYLCRVLGLMVPALDLPSLDLDCSGNQTDM